MIGEFDQVFRFPITIPNVVRMQQDCMHLHLDREIYKHESYTSTEGQRKSTHHTICQLPPLLEMGSQAVLCRFETQASNEQLPELLRLLVLTSLL